MRKKEDLLPQKKEVGEGLSGIREKKVMVKRIEKEFFLKFAGESVKKGPKREVRKASGSREKRSGSGNESLLIE
ncbi:hypothetical protein SANA_30310 [Gottschalkiaceae bacterium SANA]|nr:hypothetical protein SANA_30310 [Gottschalkiaceae bacterium SANA]